MNIINRVLKMHCGMSVALICAVVAYGSFGPRTASASVTLRTAQPSSFDQMQSMLDSMLTTANELNNANQLALEKCMESKGLKFYSDIGATTVSSQTAPMPYGSAISLADALTRGYGLYAQFESFALKPKNAPQSSSQEEKYIESLPPAEHTKYDLVLNGPSSARQNYTIPDIGTVNLPKQGCAEVADVEVYGSAVSAEETINESPMILGRWTATINSDSRILQLDQSWSSCMSKSGLTIKTPDIAYEALESAFEESGPTPVLKARELKTATADVRCENEGNWSNQLRDREGADAAEVMKSQAAFILHAQQVDKRDLAQLSSSKR